MGEGRLVRRRAAPPLPPESRVFRPEIESQMSTANHTAEVREWIEHRRDGDGELVGFLVQTGDRFTAMTVFGSPLAEPAERDAAERVLDASGLSYLADRWWLHVDDQQHIEVEIVGASPERVVVKNVDFNSGLDHGHRIALVAPVGRELTRA